jgi:hypothetical protein
MDYLMIEPTDIAAASLGRGSSGTFYWDTDHDTAAKNAFQFFVGSKNSLSLLIAGKPLNILFLLYSPTRKGSMWPAISCTLSRRG